MLSINVSKLNKSAIRARQTSFTTTGAIWSIWAKAILVLSELWKLCLPVKAAMWNQKRLAALFTCFGKVYIPLDSSTRSKENLEPCSRLCKVGSTGASEKKSTWKADFGPLILWLFFIGNSGNEGQSTKQREHWSNKKILGGSFVCTGLCLIRTATAGSTSFSEPDSHR